ncbi:MAG: hypothetical protein Q9227_002290 [Pyrenula ochraceoflavens]
MLIENSRYNLKRRVASLPPIPAETFNDKVLTAQATSNAAAAKAAFERSCNVCEKTYFSENAYKNHVGSSKHKARVAVFEKNLKDTDSMTGSAFSLGDPINVKTPSAADSEAEAEFDHVVEGMKDTSLAEKDPLSNRPSRPHHSGHDKSRDHPLSPTKSGSATPSSTGLSSLPLSRCLFCNYESPTWKLSVEHMTKIHGLFIPEKEFLVDPEGMLRYFQAKIMQNHECIYCHKLKSTASGTQTHMRDKGHCMVAFETEEEMVEVGQFYDFSSTYSDDDASSEDTAMGEANDRTGGAKLTSSFTASVDEDGWETDSSASSVDSEELGAIPVDDHSHQYAKLAMHRHHSHEDPRPHRNKDGFHSHAHVVPHAVFHSEHELHLPSGRTAGHRSLARIYRQNLHSYPTAKERFERAQRTIEAGENGDVTMVDGESNGPSQQSNGSQALINRSEAGMLGATTAQRREVRAAEKRDRRIEHRARNRYQAKLERQNNFQKHYRDPEAALCHNAPVAPVDASNGTKKIGYRKSFSKRSFGPGYNNDNEGAREIPRPRKRSRESSAKELGKTPSQAPNTAAQPSAGVRIRERTNSSIRVQAGDHFTEIQAPSQLGAAVDEPKKDPRSFTQTLFDTVAMRMLEWLPIRQVQDSPPAQDPRPVLERGLSDAASDIPQTSLDPTSIQKELPVRSKCNSTLNTSQNGSLSRHSAPGKSSTAADRKKNRKRPDQDQEEPVQKDFSDADDDLHLENCVEGAGKVSKIRTSSNRRISVSHMRQLDPDGPGPPQRAISRASPSRSRSNESLAQLKKMPKEAEPNWKETERSSSGEVGNQRHTRSRSHIKSPADSYENVPGSADTLRCLNRPILKALLDMQRNTKRQSQNKEKVLPESAGKPSTELKAAIRAFTEQSFHYVLKDPWRLMASFYPDNTKRSANLQICSGFSEDEKPTVSQLWNNLQLARKVCRQEHIWDSLWLSLGHLFIPPPDLVHQLNHGRKQSRRSKSTEISSGENAEMSLIKKRDVYLSDAEAAQICTVALMSLAVAELPHSELEEVLDLWSILRTTRDDGYRSLPNVGIHLDPGVNGAQTYLELMDHFDNISASRLVRRLVTALSNRVAFSEISKARPRRERQKGGKHPQGVLRQLWTEINRPPQEDNGPACRVAHLTIAWMNTLITDEWDGKARIRRSSVIGGALQMLAAMYEMRKELDLNDEDFHVALLSELDPMEIPEDWLSYKPDNKMLHILSFPFLFRPSSLVKYFRAINYSIMAKAYENAMAKTHLVRQFFREDTVQIHNERQLLLRLRPAMATYLVLTVRRDNLLEDTFNQLWRREKRELMRPLKVLLGKDEGEQGLDQGGVQQEFFRILLAEALNPDYGMFTVDESTRMTWFQPGSTVPLWKFEMLGLLFSLAIYNGVTLPVTFPLAFYRKLLGLKVKKIEHIEDGWPELARGFRQMLDWTDGDVGDVFMRTYEFSYDVYGSRVDVDMEKVGREAPWPRGKYSSKGKEKAKSASFDVSGSEIKSAFKKDDSSAGPSQRSSVIITSPSSSPIGKAGEPSSSTATANPSTSSSSSSTSARPPPSPAPLHRRPPLTPVESPPSPPTTTTPSSEPSLVTNATRHPYISDYIFWLTTKSISPQYDSFHRGLFSTCSSITSQHALSLFPPATLRLLIEGLPSLDIDALASVTRYEEPYHAEHPTIRDFWGIVREEWDEGLRRGLLEFVTSSARVPVGGEESVAFVVQRNGDGEEDERQDQDQGQDRGEGSGGGGGGVEARSVIGKGRLPTSMTCFGRLLLPEYRGGREVLRERLEKAVREGVGFGMV